MTKYLEIKNEKVIYNGVDLTDFAIKNGTPTKIVFLDIIENQIKILKDAFNQAIVRQNYQGKFYYLNANKANYSSEIVYTAGKFADGIETSSAYDLEYTCKLIKTMPDTLKNKLIVCNGYKQNDYLDKIISMHKSGHQIINVIDSLSELNYLLSIPLEKPLDIGLRISLSSKYGHNNEYDRFGLSEAELEIAKEKIKASKNLNLTTIHFHQRGFEYEKDKFYQNLNLVVNVYTQFKKEFPSIIHLDIGGGTPWFSNIDFNYTEWANEVLETLKIKFNENNIPHPNLIIENGKYTVKDSIVNLYKVVGTKNTDKNYTWYILNCSLLLAIPEYYACGEKMHIQALNHLNAQTISARLAGITCDCDDIYYEENGLISLPKVGQEPLFIGVLGTGSYQESMASRKGIRHCLIPEEARFISFIKNGERQFVLAEPLQSPEDIYALTKLEKENLNQFD